MKILVFANDKSWNELVQSKPDVEWIRSANNHSFLSNNGADAYFNLLENAAEMEYASIQMKPVYINSVITTLKKMGAARNIYRINGWNGFIKRDSWEVAGNLSEEASAILTQINKHAIVVPDEPGFIAARVISMIINEAYFAKEENVSTEKEIDIAMKLGTNYPFGPFEWSKLIGLRPIYHLLKILSEDDYRYKPSSLLEQEAK